MLVQAIDTAPGRSSDAEPAASKAALLDPADRLLLLLWGGAGAAMSALGFLILGSVADRDAFMDVWFQADVPRVIANLTDLGSSHYRTAVHPLSALLFTPLVHLLIWIGLPPMLATKLLISLAGAVCAALIFATLRIIGLPRLAASSFVALYLTSATYLHWYACVELAPLAGMTIAAALLALALGRRLGRVGWVLMSAATLSVTVTNWSAGLAATLARRPLRQAVILSGLALALVISLSVAQKYAIPSSRFFLNYKIASEEVQWTQINKQRAGEGQWRPDLSLSSLFVTTMVSPEPQIDRSTSTQFITNQYSGIGTLPWNGRLAVVAWITLLCLGIFGAFRARAQRPVVLGLGLMLLAQVVLHSVYGEVTFLYAPHFAPMLIVLSALSWFAGAHRLVVGLALVVALLGGSSNLLQVRTAAALANTLVEEKAADRAEPALPERRPACSTSCP